MNFIKILKWGFGAVIVVLLLPQCLQPARTNPPVKTDFLKATGASPRIAEMFRAACYDCHSNETRWPWYSYLAPVSWQVAQDVYHGRKHVNFSEWPPEGSLDLARRKMEDMSDAIDDGDMPLKKYTLIHKDARLTQEQRDDLTQWLDDQADALKSKAVK